MLSRLRQRLENRRLNRLADMKRKTTTLRERRKQYDAEERIRKDYEREKVKADDRSLVGKIKKRVKSSGIFSEEAKIIKSKAKKTTTTRNIEDDNDTFKKWGM